MKQLLTKEEILYLQALDDAIKLSLIKSLTQLLFEKDLNENNKYSTIIGLNNDPMEGFDDQTR